MYVWGIHPSIYYFIIYGRFMGMAKLQKIVLTVVAEQLTEEEIGGYALVVVEV